MQNLLNFTVRTLESGQPVCLVSLLQVTGSSPRSAGALMAVSEGGEMEGTIGGGMLEWTARQRSLEQLKQGKNAACLYRMNPDGGFNMICGGDALVHYQCLSPDAATISLFRELGDALGDRWPCWLVRHLQDAEGNELQHPVMGLAVPDRAEKAGIPAAEIPHGLLQESAVWRDGWFSLPLVQAGRVCVFGGGHVALALAPLLTHTDFRFTVYDDRPAFTGKERFPGAELAVCALFEDLDTVLPVHPEDYVVVMTHGHVSDLQVLSRVLPVQPRYVGCIGSRRKSAACRKALLEQGFPEETVNRIHSPVGLPIGAETPAEISVSIVAELISVRAESRKVRQ